jgi:hypothetical protein
MSPDEKKQYRCEQCGINFDSLEEFTRHEYVTVPSAAANTIVFSGATKSIAFSSLPEWAGEESVSILISLSRGIGSWYLFLVTLAIRGLKSFV